MENRKGFSDDAPCGRH